ncbi:MAG: hypothetical protein MUE94_02635 [Verrucomicrobia bacterium]|jgi:hypothetical protein|nr:hypothetical protein [Verrucomicrobiota bacterium]
MKARTGKEVTVRVHNEIGVLAQLARIVADKGINILAVCAWVEGPDAVVRMITNDNLRVMDALRERHYNPRESGVVLMESGHKPGMLRHITEKLAGKNIDLHHLYATAPDDQNRVLMAFASANNDQAIVLLND